MSAHNSSILQATRNERLQSTAKMRPSPKEQDSTCDPCRGSPAFKRTFNDIEEHGRHCKSLEVHHRQRYCVSRCVSRVNSGLRNTRSLGAHLHGGAKAADGEDLR